jgi:tRNA threonylcarbamoyladenosine biosynthesis protein TsaB
MPSLPQLLTSHFCLLVLDATSMKTQVGILRPGSPAVWTQTGDEAGRGVFAGIEEILPRASCAFADVGAFLFCEGPGSTLGTRTIAMALRTWQVTTPRPVYAYQSLAVAAVHEWICQPPRAFSVIADGRRDTWHCQSVAESGNLSPLRRLSNGELPAGEWVTPENFRAWATPPRPARTCSYDLEAIFSTLGAADCFHATGTPDAFQPEAPEYKKWSAQIHQSSPPVKT